jgi:hypothetical protein
LPNKIAELFGSANWAMRVFGVTLGISIALWTVWKGAVVAGAIAVDLAKAALVGYRAVLISVAGVQGISGLIGKWRAWGFAMETVDRLPAWKTISGFRRHTTQFVQKGVLGRMTRAIFNMVPALVSAAAASWSFTASLLANPITWIVAGILLLTIGLVVLYFKWKRFHELVDKTFHLMEKFPWLAFLIPVYGQVIFAIIFVEKLYHWLKRIYDLLANPLEFKLKMPGSGFSIGDFLARANPVTAPFAWANLASKAVGGPHAQHGGTVTSGGLVTVGETGPEIVSLPAAASVIPLGGGGTGNPLGWSMPTELNLKAILRVDGKDLAEVVAKHRLDRTARR